MDDSLTFRESAEMTEYGRGAQDTVSLDRIANALERIAETIEFPPVVIKRSDDGREVKIEYES